ncbi:hypothetical protein AKO1_008219, partial [Acrasis kona]
MLQDGFCEKNRNCILISGRGYPDVATRSLIVKLLQDIPQLLAYVFVDADPHGLEIANVYINGSQSLSMYKELTLDKDSRNKRIKWIGLSLSDLIRLNLSLKVLVKLSDQDLKKANSLLSTSKSPDMSWLRLELEQITLYGYKAEIQALSSISVDYVSNVFIPSKIPKY